MKALKLLILSLLLGAAGWSSAWADRGHGYGHYGHGYGYGYRGPNVGIVVGPFWGSRYYPPYPNPYYYTPPYYPPVVVERPVPQIYIEQQSLPAAVPPVPATAIAPGNFWYYCAETRAYYPYVKDCAGGWLKVPPQPAGQP